jgi:hypothetical protein
VRRSEQFTVLHEKQVPKAMKFTPREFQTAHVAQPEPRVGEATTLSKAPGATSANAIGFFEAREWLSAGFKESRKEFEINRKAGRLATRQILSVCRGDRLEESFYWLLSAAIVAYLIVAIIGL